MRVKRKRRRKKIKVTCLYIFKVFNLGHFFNCYGTRCQGPFDGASHTPEVAGGMGTGNKSNRKYQRKMVHKEKNQNYSIEQSMAKCKTDILKLVGVAPLIADHPPLKLHQ